MTAIGHLENIKPPASKAKVSRALGLDDSYEDVQHSGAIEGGQASASMFYDPTDDQHEVLLSDVHSTDFATLTAAARKRTWNVVFNQLATPRTWAFIGICSQFDVTASAGELLKADVSVEVERSTTLPV